jgi:hypothetical protein
MTDDNIIDMDELRFRAFERELAADFAKRVSKLAKEFLDEGAYRYDVACALVREAKGVLVRDEQTEEEAREWIDAMLGPDWQ